MIIVEPVEDNVTMIGQLYPSVFLASSATASAAAGDGGC